MNGESAAIPKAVWVYLLMAFAISWGLFAIRKVTVWPDSIDETLRIAIKFGPSVAGVLAALQLEGVSGARKLLVRLFVPSPRIGWVATAFGLPLAVLAVALLLRGTIGGPVLPSSSTTALDAVVLFVTLLATRFFLGGGLGEEFGWRGFMLPVLQQRMHALDASIVIGLFHGAWHLPAYGLGAVVLTLFTVAGAIVFTWMYNRTGGNLFLPALMHATANASLPFLETLVPAVDQELLFPLLVFSVWAALAGLIVWRVGRDGLNPGSAPAPGQVC